MGIAIPQAVVQELIAANVQKAILDSFQGQEGLLAKAVTDVLMRRVDPNRGDTPRYASDNSITYLEYLAKSAIEEAARQAINKYFFEQAPVIEAAILEQLTSTDGGARFAASLMQALQKTLKDQYAMRVAISFAQEEKRNDD